MPKTNSLTVSFKIVLRFTLFAFLFSPYFAKAQPISKEYQVKSTFLFNFSKFVTWPASAFEGLESPFIIGIVGDDPFGSYLDETIAGEKVEDHPVIAKRYKSAADIGDCHILFINRQDSILIMEVLAATKDRKILTVSEAKNFTSMGGMIAFYTAQDIIRLDINAAAAKYADLVISSKLLRLAEVENQ